MTITNQTGGFIPSELLGKKLSLKTIFMFNFVWIIMFAVIYFLIGQSDNQFNHTRKTLTFLDALYFSVTTQTRIGYGDISPRSTIAKIFVMIQQLSVMFEIVAIISENIKYDILNDIGNSLSKENNSLKSGIWNPDMVMPDMPDIPVMSDIPVMPDMQVSTTGTPSVSLGVEVIAPSNLTPFKQNLIDQVNAPSSV